MRLTRFYLWMKMSFTLSVRTLAEDRGAKAIRGNSHFYTRVNDALQKPHLIKATSGN